VLFRSKSTPSATVTDNARIFASPLAKKIAEDKGINLAQVKGSGENGRIVKNDVDTYKANNQTTVAAETAPAAQATTSEVKTFVPAGEIFSEEIKNSTMRKVIAKRLSESIFTAPHFYLTIEVNMDEAMKSRATINSLPDTKVSFNDMVIKACAMALKKHLKVNSQWREDATVINHHVNIGVAVAVEDGLVVPVLKFTDAMSLSQIGGNVKDLAGRAKNKKLQPAEMEGSTFTVSNLGMFGITEFTSIINQPNSAILSVGAIVEKPVVKNGQIVVGNTMKVTLACDHRTVDGATGAQFLQTLRQYLENPVTMLA
jgi:pyruvate dehydrogenase E2 component (dihydrolipoamide acetyltransferase)